jgi:DNA transformation protein
MLIDADILDVATLRSLGSIESYRRLRFIHGKRVTLNFVYAMECAIRGIDWRMLDGMQKSQLRTKAGAVEVELAALAGSPNRPPA